MIVLRNLLKRCLDNSRITENDVKNIYRPSCPVHRYINYHSATGRPRTFAIAHHPISGYCAPHHYGACSVPRRKRGNHIGKCDIMATQTKRSTIYFDPDLHKALRLKAAETSRSITELVNEAVREALSDDAEDLAAFSERKHDPVISYDEMVKRLKKDGRI